MDGMAIGPGCCMLRDLAWPKEPRRWQLSAAPPARLIMPQLGGGGRDRLAE
jgi:hypothetical protein